MLNQGAIGVFDSGVGGLSVLREIRSQLPAESLLYVADAAYVPYGEKSPTLIRQRCQRIAGFLQEQGAKALVVACNTATAAAVTELRQKYPQLPVLGMEPAVKPAAAATRSGVVGVLATTGTLKSARFAALLDRFAGDIQVLTMPCPGLVERIEQGELDSPYLRQMVQGFVQPLLNEGCDTLILGCTHYPFIRPVLTALLPPEVILIDTAAAVARHLAFRLDGLSLLNPEGGTGSVQFWSSGACAPMAQVLPVLWGQSGTVAHWL